MRPLAVLAPSLLALALAALSACSSETGGAGGGDDGPRPPDGACWENPLGCGDGETCAFDDADGEAMSCQAAGEKDEGAACKNVAANPECGPDLFCLQLETGQDGVCAEFCDGDAPCDGGQTCGQITTESGHRFYACVDG